MKLIVLLPLLAVLLPPPAQASAPSEDIPLYAISLVGSPYRYGGTSPETGLDCSGFIGHVFRQAAGVMLPRTSLAISQFTQPLAQTELLPGDLVFFNTLNRAFSHVGIYLGENRFVHAASTRAGRVMISSLTDRYWRTRFEGARRVATPREPGLAPAPLVSLPLE